ncbi:MAG: hypothetical protein Fur003_5090 [Candidatus Dojkabacteria bacterium]
MSTTTSFAKPLLGGNPSEKNSLETDLKPEWKELTQEEITALYKQHTYNLEDRGPGLNVAGMLFNAEEIWEECNNWCIQEFGHSLGWWTTKEIEDGLWEFHARRALDQLALDPDFFGRQNQARAWFDHRRRMREIIDFLHKMQLPYEKVKQIEIDYTLTHDILIYYPSTDWQNMSVEEISRLNYNNNYEPYYTGPRLIVGGVVLDQKKIWEEFQPALASDSTLTSDEVNERYWELMVVMALTFIKEDPTWEYNEHVLYTRAVEIIEFAKKIGLKEESIADIADRFNDVLDKGHNYKFAIYSFKWADRINGCIARAKSKVIK